ncbi:TRYP protein, partial [Dasyornis broadbenti]|nr:TRYP protein [Dasyornis broadbenti]
AAPGSPRRLQELRVPLLSLSQCRKLYGTDLGRELPPREIQDDMICAGEPGGGRDSCKVALGHSWGEIG